MLEIQQKEIFKEISKNRNYWIGIILSALGAVSFSIKAIFIKLAYRHGIEAVPLLTLRFLFSLPFYLFFIFRKPKKSFELLCQPRSLIGVICLGFFGYYLASLLDFIGLHYVSVGLERLILFLYPTFVFFMSGFFFKRSYKIWDILALILSYVGIILVFLADIKMNQVLPVKEIVFGALLILLSAFCYAFYFIGNQKYVKKFGIITLTSYVMITAIFAVLIQYLSNYPLSNLIHYSPVIYIYAISMAVFSTVLPSFLTSAAISRIGAFPSAAIGGIGPISTLILGFIILGEPMSLLQTIGTIVVIIGVLILGKNST